MSECSDPKIRSVLDALLVSEDLEEFVSVVAMGFLPGGWVAKRVNKTLGG
jgi:hypothetical protein